MTIHGGRKYVWFFSQLFLHKSSWITSLIQSWLTSKCDKISPTVIFWMLELCHDIWDSEESFNMVNYNSFTEVKLGPPKSCIPTSFMKNHWKSCNFTQWRGLPISFIWTVRLPGHWNISVAGATVVERLLRPELGIGTWSRPVANQTWILLWYTTILE